MHDHNWLRECRKAMGLEQREIADLLGFTPNSIYRKESERYRQKITARDVRDILGLLRRSLDESKTEDEFPKVNKEAVTAILGREGVVR